MGEQIKFDFTTPEKQKKRVYRMSPAKALVFFMYGDDADYSSPEIIKLTRKIEKSMQREQEEKLKAASQADSGADTAACDK
jgi:hypothetical protein